MERSWLFSFVYILANIVLYATAYVLEATFRVVDWLLEAWPVSDTRHTLEESWPAESTLRGPAVSRDRQFHARRLARTSYGPNYFSPPAHPS